MKKIVSALAVGALVLGSAAAKTSVNLNYRQGTALYAHTDNGEDDKANVTNSYFNALGNFTEQDTLSLKASGDIIDLQADIQPKTDDSLRFNVLKLGAKWGNFHIQSGWNGDGINGGYRVTNDASNWDGQYFETFKLGSVFKNSLAQYADNQIEIGNAVLFTNRIMYAQADYTIPVDDLKINIKGTVISDRGWKGSVATKDTDGNVTKDSTEYNDGNKGWSVFADVSKAKVFKMEGFVKGVAITETDDSGDSDDKMNLVPGLYFQWLGTDGLIATVGGTVDIYDGDVMNYAADLRLRYAVNKQLSLTYYLNYSAIDTDNSSADSVAKNVGLANNKYWYTTKNNQANLFATDKVLWNFVNARYVVNPTVTVACGIGALTDIGDGAPAEDGSTKDANNGTTLSLTPSAEFTAGKGASIIVGLNATFAGLGCEKASSFGENTDIGFAIPMYFRVKM